MGTPENLVPGGKPLPDALYRERAAIVVALKAEHYSTKEISAMTGLTIGAVRYCLMRARGEGKLQDAIADLSNRALPQAVENLVTALEDPANEHHWTATEQTLKGLGAFKHHKETENTGGGSVIAPLQVAFIMKGGGDVPTVIVNSPRGEIGGIPRQDSE